MGSRFIATLALLLFAFPVFALARPGQTIRIADTKNETVCQPSKLLTPPSDKTPDTLGARQADGGRA